MFNTVNKTLTEEERRGRIDIQYRKTAGRHVIIELKRPKVTVNVYDLAKQIGKYRTGMRKILERTNRANEPIEIICLLGKPPIEWDGPDGRRTVEDTLKANNARYVSYDELLENASQAYSDYKEHQKTVDRLGQIITEIDNYGG